MLIYMCGEPSLPIVSSSPIPRLATVVWTTTKIFSPNKSCATFPPIFTLRHLGRPVPLQLRHPNSQGLINTDSSPQPLPHSIIPSGARDYYLPVTLVPHPHWDRSRHQFPHLAASPQSACLHRTSAPSPSLATVAPGRCKSVAMRRIVLRSHQIPCLLRHLRLNPALDSRYF